MDGRAILVADELMKARTSIVRMRRTLREARWADIFVFTSPAFADAVRRDRLPPHQPVAYHDS
jgi:hypothetical protein